MSIYRKSGSGDALDVASQNPDFPAHLLSTVPWSPKSWNDLSPLIRKPVIKDLSSVIPEGQMHLDPLEKMELAYYSMMLGTDPFNRRGVKQQAGSGDGLDLDANTFLQVVNELQPVLGYIRSSAVEPAPKAVTGENLGWGGSVLKYARGFMSAVSRLGKSLMGVKEAVDPAVLLRRESARNLAFFYHYARGLNLDLAMRPEDVECVVKEMNTLESNRNSEPRDLMLMHVCLQALDYKYGIHEKFNPGRDEYVMDGMLERARSEMAPHKGLMLAEVHDCMGNLGFKREVTPQDWSDMVHGLNVAELNPRNYLRQVYHLNRIFSRSHPASGLVEELK
ncbi:MAG: hypothetical protein NTU61_03495 [Candidatus Altiarchaeota archaeon]|nr:hypothetical protein [Candidatus Altiarchaeota archaeon]